MKRGMNLTLSTIIIIIILVITAVAVLTFFTKGMGATGANMTGAIPGAGLIGDINPTHWGCEGGWTCIYEKGGGGTVGEICNKIADKDTYSDCLRGAGSDNSCDPSACKCKCLQ